MSDSCVLSQCCCGCSLRTGAVATAIFSLVASIITVISSIYQVVADKAALGWFNIIVNVIMLIATILLLQGVRKEKPRLIRIWVYIEIVIIVFVLISTITLFVNTYDFIGLAAGLITVAIMTYFMLVVRSYAIQLESGGGAGNTV